MYCDNCKTELEVNDPWEMSLSQGSVTCPECGNKNIVEYGMWFDEETYQFVSYKMKTLD